MSLETGKAKRKGKKYKSVRIHFQNLNPFIHWFLESTVNHTQLFAKGKIPVNKHFT